MSLRNHVVFLLLFLIYPQFSVQAGVLDWIKSKFSKNKPCEALLLSEEEFSEEMLPQQSEDPQSQTPLPQKAVSPYRISGKVEELETILRPLGIKVKLDIFKNTQDVQGAQEFAQKLVRIFENGEIILALKQSPVKVLSASYSVSFEEIENSQIEINKNLNEEEIFNFLLNEIPERNENIKKLEKIISLENQFKKSGIALDLTHSSFKKQFDLEGSENFIQKLEEVFSENPNLVLDLKKSNIKQILVWKYESESSSVKNSFWLNEELEKEEVASSILKQIKARTENIEKLEIIEKQKKKIIDLQKRFKKKNKILLNLKHSSFNETPNLEKAEAFVQVLDEVFLENPHFISELKKAKMKEILVWSNPGNKIFNENSFWLSDKSKKEEITSFLSKLVQKKRENAKRKEELASLEKGFEKKNKIKLNLTHSSFNETSSLEKAEVFVQSLEEIFLENPHFILELKQAKMKEILVWNNLENKTYNENSFWLSEKSKKEEIYDFISKKEYQNLSKEIAQKKLAEFEIEAIENTLSKGPKN